MKDLYAVLNVSRDADEAVIRSAYRQLVAQYHPDRNPSEDAAERFREVKLAYDVLGNPERRVLYDHHGELALNPNFRGFQSDADAAADRRSRFGDFFAQFREGYDGAGPSSDVNHDAGFPEFKFGERGRRSQSRSDNHSFHSPPGTGGGSPHSARSEFRFNRSGRSAASKRSSRPYGGTSPAQDRYEDFDPSKVRSSFQSTVENSFSSTSKFVDADRQNISVEEARQYGIPREGEDISVTLHISLREAIQGCQKNLTVSRPSRWKTSGSERESHITEQVPFTVPVNAQSHSTFRIKGKGARGVNGARSGDIIVTLEVQPHPYFFREGLNLFSMVPLTWMEHIEGCVVDVPTLDAPARVTIPAGVRPGQKLRLKGRGITLNGERGDLYLIMMPILPDCSERSPDEQERINRLAADISNLYPSGGLREDWSL